MTWQQKLKHELKAVGLATLYFGTWLAALLLLKQLVLAEYHVAFHHYSMALVGALILSKVVLVLEHVPLGAWLRSRPACLDVVLRTVLYSFGVLVVLVLEKGIEARHEHGGFGPAVVALFRQTDVHHVWVNTICLSGALLGFNVLSVIRRHLGAGGCLRLLMSPLLEESEAKPPRSESLSR